MTLDLSHTYVTIHEMTLAELAKALATRPESDPLISMLRDQVASAKSQAYGGDFA